MEKPAWERVDYLRIDPNYPGDSQDYPCFPLEYLPNLIAIEPAFVIVGFHGRRPDGIEPHAVGVIREQFNAAIVGLASGEFGKLELEPTVQGNEILCANHHGQDPNTFFGAGELVCYGGGDACAFGGCVVHLSSPLLVVFYTVNIHLVLGTCKAFSNYFSINNLSTAIFHYLK